MGALIDPPFSYFCPVSVTSVRVSDSLGVRRRVYRAGNTAAVPHGSLDDDRPGGTLRLTLSLTVQFCPCRLHGQVLICRLANSPPSLYLTLPILSPLRVALNEETNDRFVKSLRRFGLSGAWTGIIGPGSTGHLSRLRAANRGQSARVENPLCPTKQKLIPGSKKPDVTPSRSRAFGRPYAGSATGSTVNGLRTSTPVRGVPVVRRQDRGGFTGMTASVASKSLSRDLNACIPEDPLQISFTLEVDIVIFVRLHIDFPRLP